MTCDQLALSLPDPRQGRSRKSDPRSSKDAAKSMSGDVLTKQQREVLSVVVRCEHGANAYEVACQLGYQQNVMASRLSELGGDDMRLLYRRQTEIRDRNGELIDVVYESRPGGTGRKCDVWRATERGHNEACGTLDVVVTGDRL